MTRYSQAASATPQNEQAKTNQVENNAGGYVFKLDKWKRLDRFLILGAEGATYYCSENKMQRDNIQCVEECLADNGVKLVDQLVAVSDAGRAPKNDPAIFALACACVSKDEAVRRAAYAALPKVCRIGTHLFHWAQDVQSMHKLQGRMARTAIGKWYTERHPLSLATQLIKYQQRDGWSHRDLLRLAHPKPTSPEQDAAFRWATGGMEEKKRDEAKGPWPLQLPHQIIAFEQLKTTPDKATVVKLVTDFKLPRECVPTQWLNEPEVWDALLPHMGVTAVVRNLGKMTSVGLIKPLSAALKTVSQSITDRQEIKKQRVHPMQFLLAMGVYKNGHGEKGKLSWKPESAIVDALNDGFYMGFDAVEKTGLNHLIALDVSGSMGAQFNGSALTVREASAAMAMVTMKTEPWFHCIGFTGQVGVDYRTGQHTLSTTVLELSPKQRLDQVVESISDLPFGRTDCSLPMLYAMAAKLDVDVFCIYTDNETWAGAIHPFQALDKYRKERGKPKAKLVVCGMTSTGFSIANPDDAGSLDVVGFDTSVPQVVRNFVLDQ